MRTKFRKIFFWGVSGLLLVVVVVLLAFRIHPSQIARRHYEHWVQDYAWQDLNVSRMENASNRLEAVRPYLPEMVSMAIMDLEEEKPWLRRVIDRSPEFVKQMFSRPFVFQRRKHAAVALLEDVGPTASNAVPALIDSRFGTGDMNLGMYVTFALGTVGKGSPEAIAALEGMTNLSQGFPPPQVAAAFSIWRLDTNRLDALNIVSENLIHPTPNGSTTSLNTIMKIGEWGEPARAFAPAIRSCLTNSVNGMELDIHWRAHAAQAYWRLERSNEGLDPVLDLVTNLPPDSSSDSISDVQIRRLASVAYYLRELDGAPERVQQMLRERRDQATEEQKEKIDDAIEMLERWRTRN